jgi:hypothetical protein
MASVPRTPSDFFLHFVPSAFSAPAAASSKFAVSFEVTGAGVFSLRLRVGKLEAEPGLASDVLLRVSLSPEAFEGIVVPMAERAVATPAAEPELMAVKALTLDADRERLLRETRGTMVLSAASGSVEHRVSVSAGDTAAGAPACEVSCSLEDLWALQSGKANPIELLMNGKIRITGDAQLALSLSAVLG